MAGRDFRGRALLAAAKGRRSLTGKDHEPLKAAGRDSEGHSPARQTISRLSDPPAAGPTFVPDAYW